MQATGARWQPGTDVDMPDGVPALGPLRYWQGDGRLQAASLTPETWAGHIHGAFAASRLTSAQSRAAE